MAVFTAWFDQPMFIGGNASRPMMFARPGELDSTVMLRCAATDELPKSYFFANTLPPLIVLPSRLSQREKSPEQLRREHRRMLE